MNTINLEGIHDGNNFIVDTLAKYIRDNNYPELQADEIVITANDVNKYRGLVSQEDKFLEWAKLHRELFPELFPREWRTSSDVCYQCDGRGIYMIIDNHYYWTTW